MNEIVYPLHLRWRKINPFLLLLFLLIASNTFAQTPYPGCPNVQSKPKDASLTVSNDSVYLKCGQTCVDLEADFLQTGLTNSYTVASIPYVPPFPFVGGTPIFANTDDVYSGVINLPFNFCFYGNTYNKIVVGANGSVTFNLTRALQGNNYNITNPIPNAVNADNNAGQAAGNGNMQWNSIYGAFHDMNPATGNPNPSINYSVLGTAPCRTFVVNWSNVAPFVGALGNCPNRTTQQIVIYETTNVIEIYIKSKPLCTASTSSGRAVIGIQNNFGTAAVAPPGRNTGAWTATDEAWRFSPTGAPNYTIEWKDPNGVVVANGKSVNICPSLNSPIKYTVEITYTNCDNVQVIEKDDIIVVPKPQINATSTSTPVKCNGDSNGIGNVTITGGVAPFTITWPDGVKPANRNDLSAGSYSVTVTDVNGCSSTTNINITEPTALTSSITSKDALCFGSTDGTSKVTASGGTTPYTYKWSSNETVDNITKGKGSYTVTVSDKNGCTTSNTAIINEPSLLVLDTMLTFLSCPEKKDGEIIASATGGTPPYQFSKDGTTFVGSGTFTGLENKSYPITVRDNNNCKKLINTTLLSDSVKVIAPNNFTVCQGQTITLSGSGVATSYLWDNGVIDNVPFNATGTGVTRYIVEGDNGKGCIGKDTVFVTVNAPPVIALDSTVCNNTSTGYVAYFTLSGGQASSYTINGNPVTGNKFISTLLPAGSSNTFTLSDQNNCTPQSSVTVVKSCNCLSDAGTLAQTPIKICGNAPAIAQPNADTFADGNDKIVYVLHDNPGTSLGTIYDTSLTPTFTYDPAWGIVYGNTYYITRVVGDASMSMPNFVDFNNPNGCMDVAIGQPVVFHEIPSVTASITSQICRGQSTDMVFTFVGGKQNYSVQFNDGTGNFTATGLSGSNNKFSITPSQIGLITYSLTQLSDTNGCSATLNQKLNLTVVDRPDTTTRVITCNSTNTAYTVSFNISQGDPVSYTVNGTSSGAAFTSAPITSGAPFSFVVNDINNCLPLNVAGSHTCPCVTDAGDMNAVPIIPSEFCITSPAVAAHNGTKTLDGNDALSFILCSNPASPVTSLIQHNKTPSFNFNAATMTTGTVYYIVPIAGDSTPSGLYDVNTTACFNSGNAYPVRFLEVPTVRAIGAFEICDGQTVVVNYVVTGDASKMIDFTLNRPDGTAINHSFAPGNRTSAALTPVYSFAINDSIKYNVLAASIRYAGSPACAGNLLGDSVRIKINPTPSATLAGSFIICQGESIDIPYTTSGNGNITTNFSGNGLAVASKTLPAGNHTFTVAPTSAGVFTYNITSVSSNTGNGACTGAAVGPFTVTVRATPSANISVTNPIICLNQSTQVQLQGTGFYSLRAYYHDNNNVKFSQVLANGNVTLAGSLLSPTADAIYTLDSVADATVSNKSMRSCFRNYNNNNTASVRVNPLPTGDLQGNNAICFGNESKLTFVFANNGPYNFSYSDGVSAPISYTGVNSPFEVMVKPMDDSDYKLLSLRDNNGCDATVLNDDALVVVNDIPKPDFTATIFESCPPLVTTFINTTDASLSGECTWNFGDGTTATGCGNQPKIYDEDGKYSISLAVISPQGCVGTTKTDFVTVHPFPQADFSWDPQVPNNLSNSVVQFYNQSVGGSTYNWEIINNQGQSIEQSTAYNPSYDFASDDSATYQVKLLTTTAFGCQDSIEKRLRVTGELIVFAPNSFTPNGDGTNDIFLPIMNGFVPVSYELFIFNRWGELVFSTKDYKQGWNGIYKGEKAKSDNYIYKLKVRSKYSAEKRDVSGNVFLND